MAGAALGLSILAQTSRNAGDTDPQSSSFGEGLLRSFTDWKEKTLDCASGLTSGVTPIDVPPQYKNEKTHALCKALGATAGIVGDAALGAAGFAEATGGGAISLSGVGAVIGVPVAAAGVAEMGVAAAGAAIHTNNLSDAITQYRKADDTSSSSSRGSPQRKETVRDHGSRETARNKTLDEIGDLGHDKVKTEARLGDDVGKANGFQSADGKRGFRVDYDPEKGTHYNWYDWSKGNRGTGGRWGAETFPGTKADYAKLIEQLNR